MGAGFGSPLKQTSQVTVVGGTTHCREQDAVVVELVTVLVDVQTK